jgi:hypothetical protein
MDSLARGPVFKSELEGEQPLWEGGPSSKDRIDYESKMRRWREAAREEAYNHANLNPEREATEKYVQALQGNWWDKKRARYKSKFFDNRLNNSRRQDLALLTDTRPTIDISSNTPAYAESANVVTKVIHHEWFHSDMDISLVTAADISMLNGTGFWKLGAAAPGSMQVLPCGPDSVMPIQPQFHLQDSTAVLYRTWKSLNYFRRKFPFAYAGLERDSTYLEQQIGGQARFARPDWVQEYTWNGMSPAFRRVIGVRTAAEDIQTDNSMFRSVELQEYWVDDQQINESKEPVLMRHPYLSLAQHNWWYWVKPGKPLYPRKRLLVFAGRRLMYDGPSPYWHGMYPFACLRLNPVPWSFWGLSKYRDLMPLNRAMNEIGAGIMDMVTRALNPIAITKAGAVPVSSWNQFFPDMPGGRLYMLPNANISTDLRYMDPPNIPAWVIQGHQYLNAEFDRLSGSIDMGAMGKKKQMPGGDAIEQMRDSQNSSQRLDGRFLEAFLRDAGLLAMSNVFQHYQMPMRLRLLGADGITWEDFESNGPNLVPKNSLPKEDHWKSFSMQVAPGSLHGGSKDREKQIAMNLASRHLLPIKEMYRKLELGNPEQLYQSLIEEQQQMGQHSGSGRTPRTSQQKKGQAV